MVICYYLSRGGIGAAESTGRQACIRLLRHQHVEIRVEAGDAAIPVCIPPALSRAERIHAQFSWTKRLARNARPETARLVIIQLFGVSDLVATLMG